MMVREEGAMEGGWSRSGLLMLAACALLESSCASRRAATDKDVLSPAEQSKAAVTDSINKEIVPPANAKPAERAPGTVIPGEPIWLRSGKSRVLQLRNPIRRVSIGDPDVASIVVLGPRTVMLNARPAPGGPPAADMTTRNAGVVTGRTLTPEPVVRETTLMLWDGGERPDVHTLTVADFSNQQVLLEVTVAEINRTAMEEHGIDFRNMATSFASAYFMGGGFGPGSVGLVPPNTNFPLSTTSTSPTYAFHLPKEDITAFIQLLQTEGLATILAQPKLTAMSGQNAVFQVGGEIPIRIATGFTSDVQFKPFGTIVNFVPRVSDEGDIMLTVTPEVSQPDFNSPVEGIPSFRTRRASTAAQLRNGETLVIGGLLQKADRELVSGVPYLQDIPFVGYVFRSTQHTSEITELLVVVTPHVVAPMPVDTELALPTDRGPLTNGEIRTQPNPYGVTRPRLPGMGTLP
jgi:Flp pilus assembly secretin CpaC